MASLPVSFLRALLFPLTRLVYSIRVEGRGNVPREGPVLLVSNHVSFIDAFLIAAASRRAVRFLMFRAYYDLPVAGRLFRAMRCIPISDRDSPKALVESFGTARAALQAGEAVCIFAEGEISRHGQMLRFKKGFERIVDGLSAPVVPVHLDQVWGSIFSFAGGRVLLKRPRRLPYPVTVSFGKPMPSSVQAFAVRQVILELGAAAFIHRLRGLPPLPLAFARQARRHPRRLAVADSTGLRFSYGQTLVRALLLGGQLDRGAPPGPVGVFVPPSVGAALANLGLSLVGRVPVNLNYTASQEVISACQRKAEISCVVTSRRFVQRLGWAPEGPLVYLEDEAKRISRAKAAFTALALRVLPGRLVERLWLKRAAGSIDDLATIIFTSGSTGLPKGVMLSHANILSNIEALDQVYQLGPDDRVLGVLPFFHSFGFTATLWLPLVSGMGAVYHYNPLEAGRIAELAARYRPTFLLATPTFLQRYLRRIGPGAFKSLRYVVVGAEKLRAELARAFAEKFGIEPLEGYGSTELSPVAAVNIPDIDWPGVRQKGTKPGTIGHPLPGVFIKVVDPETGEALPPGKPGLMLVKGPNVMKGYLGEEEKDADSWLRQGYYASGDIGFIDADGFVTITDRLSRFSKIAGEMVPHIRVEEKLHELAGLVEQSFVVTSVADAKRGERLVVLHKGYDDIDGLWRKLKESDLPKLWLPDKDAFHKVENFPVLGSGKLDLQALRTLALRLETRP